MAANVRISGTAKFDKTILELSKTSLSFCCENHIVIWCCIICEISQYLHNVFVFCKIYKLNSKCLRYGKNNEDS